VNRPLSVVVPILLLATFAIAEDKPQDKPQKNVQILKGLSAHELQRTMNLMRASLGVHCDYCHVNTEEGGWQWEKDDKKEKQRAREMIRMTMQINAESFGGRPIVSCNTCHNGSTHPNALPVLPQPKPAFPTPVRDTKGFPAAKELVAKYVAAVGGAEKALIPANASTELTIGTREWPDGKSRPLRLERRGDDLRLTVTTPDDVTTTQVVHGDGGWIQTGDKVRDMRPSDYDNFRELARTFRLFAPTDVPDDARVVAKEQIDGKDVWVVAARSGSESNRWFFDAASGLVLRRITSVDGPVGRLPRQTDFGDNRRPRRAPPTP
jgi:hypothetical protein